MRIKFAHSIVFVKDIEASKKFYRDIIGVRILQDHKVFIIFEGDFAIHQARELYNTIYKTMMEDDSILQGKNNIDIYFECDELDKIYAKLKEHNVRFIHEIEEQAWGQKVMRFYDPDMHIVEIGEPSFKCF